MGGVGDIVFAGLSPHPPIIVPEIGGAEVERARKTRQGLLRLAEMVKEAAPETIVIVGPHGPVFRDAVAVLVGEELAGDFAQFGAGGLAQSWRGDDELARAILQVAREKGIPARGPAHKTLDYATLVPLHYLRERGVEARLVSMVMGMLPRPELFRFGSAVREACARVGRRAVFLASGDLSHRLKPGAPAGYDPLGKTFDAEIVAALGKNDARAVLELEEDLAERAGECGLRPIIILLGAVSHGAWRGEVLSYEGPFGVGYAVAAFTKETAEGGAKETPDKGGKLVGKRGANEHPLVALARTAIEGYVREGKVVAPPSQLTPEMRERAGAFVSLHRKRQLRGCIGTIAGTEENVAHEVIRNAISAAARDPRFPPLAPAELADLEISVDVLRPAEPVTGPEQLDPKRYGLIVRKGNRSGLLLPALEGVDTVEEQVHIAKLKAGIGPAEQGVELFRFEVNRFH